MQEHDVERTVLRGRTARSRRAAIAAAVVAMATLVPIAAGPTGAAAQTEGAGDWELTAPLSVPRYDHTTTLMENGRVLAAAGRLVAPGQPVELLATAEVYDSRTEQWGPTDPMNDARWAHTATLLPDGRVLVAGGFTDPYGPGANAQPVLDSAEIYDPANRSWTLTEPMGEPRALHSAILLPDGRVLVAGGRTCDQPPPTACNFTFRSDSAEIFDPATGTWTPTDSLTIARHTTSAALLPDGDVLIPAGFTSAGNGSTADRYDADTGTFSATGPLNVPRARQGAMRLDDGRVLVAAGFGGGNTSEYYDPDTDTWTLTGNVAMAARFNYYFAVLPDGQALIAGGQVPGVGITTSAELYDPATGTWSPAADMNEPHGSSSSLSFTQQAVVISSDPFSFEARPQVCGDNCGKVLVAGNSTTGSVELYTPEAPEEEASLTIDDTVASDGTRAQVTGTLTCPAGEVFLVSMSLEQGDAIGRGTTRGSCIGSPQAFAVRVTAGAGSGFADGPGEACATLQSAVRGSSAADQTLEVCESVEISV